MLYGSEAWTINQQVQKHIETTEMWFLRRMLRIPWTARKTNEEVLNEAGETRKLLTSTRRRQTKFFGHVMRRKQLEHLVTTGKLNGKRYRDRQRQKILDMLADWMEHQKPGKLISFMDDRVNWRAMIANASRHGT